VKNFSTPLAIYPGRFVGIDVPWGHPKRELFTKWLKETIPMLSWDRESKRWWFPEDYSVQVADVAVQMGILQKWHLDQFEKTKAAKSIPAASVDAFGTLCLTQGAPRELIEIAYRFWSREFMGGGGNPMKLIEVEDAYNLLKGA